MREASSDVFTYYCKLFVLLCVFYVCFTTHLVLSNINGLKATSITYHLCDELSVSLKQQRKCDLVSKRQEEVACLM